MGSGCGPSIAEITPSSARQLPILAALYAEDPTLYISYSTPFLSICKYQYTFFFYSGVLRYILYFFLKIHSNILCFDSIFHQKMILCPRPQEIQPHNGSCGVILS
jgi:hypothetical protein